MIAKKIHHPAAHATKVNAPAARRSVVGRLPVTPFAICQYAPARRQKPGTRAKKIVQKTRLVRSARIR